MTQTMTNSTQPVAEATLFLPPGQRDALAGLLADIDRVLVADEAGFRRITAREDEFTLLERDGRRILVALCPEPVATDGLSCADADSATAMRLRNHTACLSVSVRSRPGSETRGTTCDPAAQKVCEEVVARVLPLAGPDLLHWASTGQLQHVEDFAETRRLAHARRPNTRTPRPAMPLLSSEGLPTDVLAHPVSRIARSAVAVPRPRRPSELRAACNPPTIVPATTATPSPDAARTRGRAQADAVFPPLAPADGDGSKSDLALTRFAIYGDGTPQFGDRDAPTVQRLSVYTLNMSLLVAAAPIGAAVLAANVIFGENMRLTSHAVALTGVSVGTDLPERALSLLSSLL
jgi:hypothetical protein